MPPLPPTTHNFCFSLKSLLKQQRYESHQKSILKRVNTAATLDTSKKNKSFYSMIHLGQSHDMPHVVCCLLPMIIENGKLKHTRMSLLLMCVHSALLKIRNIPLLSSKPKKSISKKKLVGI